MNYSGIRLVITIEKIVTNKASIEIISPSLRLNKAEQILVMISDMME